MVQCKEVRLLMDCDIPGIEGNVLVRAIWDPGVNVWVATSEEVRGLVLESESVDGLIRTVAAAMQDLIGV